VYTLLIGAKIMTLNRHYAPCFKTFFTAHHKNFNENRLILSAARISPSDSGSGSMRFIWYLWCSLERVRQMTVGLLTTAIFSAFAGIIIQNL